MANVDNRIIIDIKNSAHLFVDPRAGEGGITKDGEVVCYPQIVVNKLPRHISRKDVEKYFDTNSIPYRRIKFIPHKEFCFITCENEEQRDIAIPLIKAKTLKGSVLDPVPRTNNNQRDDRDSKNNNKRGREGGDEGDGKRQKLGGDAEDTATKQPVSAKNAVCPLWNLPYEEQCLRKAEAMRKECLAEICTAVKRTWKDTARQQKTRLPQWAFDIGLHYPTGLTINSEPLPQTEGDKQFKIEVCPLVPSPDINGYRNKCEFTFGHSNLPSGERVQSCGFRCSSYDKGVEIATPYDCLNIPNAKKLLVHQVLSYIRRTPAAGEPVPLCVFDDGTREGVFRILTTRYSKTTKDFIVMLTVNLRTTEMADWLREVDQLAALLKGLKRPVGLDSEETNIMDAVLADPSSVKYSDEPLITGFVVQVFEGLSVAHSDHPTVPIFGQEVITEHLLDCKFEVSSQAFFQVNTLAAEVLYQTAIDELRASSSAAGSSGSARSESSCLLDVCCGTGTIGLCASKQLQKVDGGAQAGAPSHAIIGVDCCASAIDSANTNAALNGVSLLDGENYQGATIASFVACKAEAILGGLLGSYKASGGATKISIPGKTTPVASADTSSASVPLMCTAPNGASVPSSADTAAIMRSLKALLSKSLYDKCYAVVDPPREGTVS